MDEIIGVREISNSQLNELKLLISEQQHHNRTLEDKIVNIESELKDIFPEKIFICEDQKAINLWENLLFEKVGINRNKFKIISSKGCTNNEVEIAVLHLMNTKAEYKPTIFRQLDRDGFTNKQIQFLEGARIKNSAYTKFGNYSVKFLPVNEIENFAILLDSYFTVEKLKETPIYDKISDAFTKTTMANIITAQKICNNDTEKEIFRSQEINMIQEARKDLLRLFPGKEIKTIKKNFNCDNLLIRKPLNDLPEELKKYLQIVRDFFEEEN